MKPNRLVPLLALIMLSAASCTTKPDAPEPIQFSETGKLSRAFSKAESEYSEKWLNRFKALRTKIVAEITGRRYSAPPEENSTGDTVIAGKGQWKIFVSKGREIVAVSRGKSDGTAQVIYTETDPAFSLKLRTSESKAFIFIESLSPTTSEIRYLQSGSASLKPQIIQERKEGVYYLPDHFGGNNIWILSNEKAPMRCLLIAPSSAPGPAYWKTAVKENDSVFIDGYTVLNLQYLVLVQKKHLATSIEITDIYPDRKSGFENKISFPQPEGSITSLSFDKDESKLSFRYSSIITPLTSYTYNLQTMHMGIRWKKKPKNYNQDDYKAQVIYANGQENEKYPFAVLRKFRAEEPEVPGPLVLFIEREDPAGIPDAFSPELFSLLDRGFTVARLRIPPNSASPADDDAIVTSALTRLISEKFSSPGSVSLVCRGDLAHAATRLAAKDPAMFRAIVMDSPVLIETRDVPGIPFSMVYADTSGNGKGLDQLRTASLFRQKMKDDNEFMLLQGNGRPSEPARQAGLITFLLSAYEIRK